MSFDDMAWAMTHRLPAPQKMTLVALANRRNDATGRCDPSLDTIAEDAGLSRSGVKLAISSLEKAGLLIVNRRSNRASTFQFRRALGGQHVTGQHVTGDDVTAQGSGRDRPGSHDVTTKQELKPRKKQEQQKPSREKREVHPLFAELKDLVCLLRAHEGVGRTGRLKRPPGHENDAESTAMSTPRSCPG